MFWPTFRRLRSRPISMFVPVFRVIPWRMSRVFRLPPVKIDAPGWIESERDPVDGLRAADHDRARQVGGVESLDGTDAAAVDGDLADVDQVVLAALAIGVTVGVALADRLGQGIDRQLGILRRAVDDDPDLAVRHRIDAYRPDRLRVLGGLNDRGRGGRRRLGEGAARTVTGGRRHRVADVAELDPVVRPVHRRDVHGLATADRLDRRRVRSCGCSAGTGWSAVRAWKETAGICWRRPPGRWGG